MLHDRPSGRELDKRLEEAKACLRDKKGLFAHPAKAVGELYELAVNDASEVWRLIGELLEEIEPSDYAGTRPPQKSYEKATLNRELFAFSWRSPKMGKMMYIKFALREGLYYYVSLHESRKIEKEGEVKNEMPAMRGRALREEENAVLS
jgi:hypothetical protein